MSGVNKCIIIGRLGKDPELKYTQSGDAVAKFSVATSETWKDKNTGEKKEKTEWHNIEAWRRLGEICNQYLHKGSQVYIEGRLKTESWEDKDGTKRYMTKIVAQSMQMLGGKNDGERKQGPSSGSDLPIPENIDDDPDSIPF